MLDLVIPVYKNMAGLYRSLFSIGTEVGDKIFVTIVDDCSGDNYDDVINFFQKFFPIRVIYQKENKGPGMARQVGLERATQPYISFLDCGDVYTSPTRLKECLHDVMDNPATVLFSWPHTEEKYSGNDDTRFDYTLFFAGNNRMHGKIYQREFLLQHGIKFSEEGSRMNEDIGFNIPIRMIAEHLWRKDGIQRVYHGDDPAVVWKVTGPSIVRAENCAFYYRDQNVGMSINGQHLLSIAYKNRVDDDLILQEIYEEMTHMYMFYCSTRNVRPEYLDSSIHGAALYYINCFKDRATDNMDMLNAIYWNTITHFVQDENDPVRAKFFPIDFPAFLNMLEEYCVNNNIVKTFNLNSADNNNGFNYVAN